METEGNFNVRWAEHEQPLAASTEIRKTDISMAFSSSLSYMSRGFSVVFLLNI